MQTETPGLYALPVVGRGGLGNMLLPWARAEIFARDHGAKLLEPGWNTIRIGPYLRREPEKRRYFFFFNASHHVRGLRRSLVMLCGHRIPEDCVAAEDLPTKAHTRPAIVTFRGLAGLFKPIVKERQFIRDQLWNMTRPTMRGDVSQYGPRFAAMHVRRGDITRQGMTTEQLNASPQYAPLSWYIEIAEAMAAMSSLRQVPIIVFTDGSRDEIRDLLAVKNVHWHKRSSPICDIWTISRASALFVGGASTFAMWASYLGGMPTVYLRGKLMQHVQLSDPNTVECERAAGEPINPLVLDRLEAGGPDIL